MGVLFESAVGDDRAFERLYSSYARNVFRYALTVLGEPADAEDVTQTTFLNAYRAFQRGERPQKPEHWLIAIAHNACRQRFRHAQRRPREVALDPELAVAAVQYDDAPTAEELRRALAELPSAQRAALVMRELEDRSYAETAAALQISVSALETLLFRARRTLREQLDSRLACDEAAAAISKQLEGRLSHEDRRMLRAHLRTCGDCARLARSRRAQTKTLRGLLTLLLPARVWRFAPQGSGVAVGTSATGGLGTAGLALKAAALVAACATLGTGVYAGTTHTGSPRTHGRPAIVAPGASSSFIRPAPAGRLDTGTALAAPPRSPHTRVDAARGAGSRPAPQARVPAPAAASGRAGTSSVTAALTARTAAGPAGAASPGRTTGKPHAKPATPQATSVPAGGTTPAKPARAAPASSATDGQAATPAAAPPSQAAAPAAVGLPGPTDGRATGAQPPTGTPPASPTAQTANVRAHG